MRSVWKGLINKKNGDIISNDSIIFENMVNKTFEVYNGKLLSKFLVKYDYVNFKVGEFVFTRKVGVSHKKKEKNLKKKKK